MEGFLNKQEREELETALRNECNAKHSDRIKCILLLDAGDPPEEIAHYLFLSSTTISNYHKRYKSGGLSDLLMDNHLGSECRLTESELKNLSSHLEDRLYQSISAIREYVLSKYKASYTESGMRHLLNRLGFVYKKPKAVPGKANIELQAEFIANLENAP